MRTTPPLLLLSALATALAAAPAFADSSRGDRETARGDRETARVSLVEGTLYVRGPFDEETEELAVNAVLRQGDEVFTEEDTFAEIELPDETFVRLASGSGIVLGSISDDGVSLSLSAGVAYVSRGPGAPGVTVGTFSGTVRVDDDSMVRVGEDAERSALVVGVATGRASLRDGEAEVSVERGESLTWMDRRAGSEAFDPDRGDAFDRWNAERERVVRRIADSPHVSRSMMGWRELDGQGEWFRLDDDWAWRPTRISAGWRPYSNGYWSWCEPWGWTFVAFEPWGYVTCHHGRWDYRAPYGWCWRPGSAWGSSWVVWAVFGGRVGWAPCDWWGRPVSCQGVRVNYDHRSWSNCDSGYFHHGGGWHRRGSYRPPLRRTCVITRGPRPIAPPPLGGRDGRDGRDDRDGLSGGLGGGLGDNGRYRIGSFDPETLSRQVPVPVRDPRAELTPRSIVDAVSRGRLPGETLQTRNGDLLERSRRDPSSIRPEMRIRRPTVLEPEPPRAVEPAPVAPETRDAPVASDDMRAIPVPGRQRGRVLAPAPSPVPSQAPSQAPSPATAPPSTTPRFERRSPALPPRDASPSPVAPGATERRSPSIPERSETLRPAPPSRVPSPPPAPAPAPSIPRAAPRTAPAPTPTPAPAAPRVAPRTPPAPTAPPAPPTPPVQQERKHGSRANDPKKDGR